MFCLKTGLYVVFFTSILLDSSHGYTQVCTTVLCLVHAAIMSVHGAGFPSFVFDMFIVEKMSLIVILFFAIQSDRNVRHNV